MKIAIVHDWFDKPGGAERVVKNLIEVYPDADIFAIVDFFSSENRKKYLYNKRVNTTFIQKLPFAKKRFRSYFPILPFAIESLDLKGYDIIISSSHAFAKGVITYPNQKHICYCYTPMRYIWDMQKDYFKDHSIKGFKKLYLSYLFHKMRIWDRLNSMSIDKFIAISSFISNRISKYYAKESSIIYPPVDIDRFKCHTEKEDYYLTASRLVPYKKIRLIAETFAKNGKKLIIAGDGPDREEIKKRVGKNTIMVGAVSDEEMVSLMQRAKAFIFASFEDFGIAPVESIACGTPVIAYGKGGALDTIEDGINGIFFYQQSTQALEDAIDRFENMKFDPKRVSLSAKKFSEDRFKKEIKNLIDNL